MLSPVFFLLPKPMFKWLSYFIKFYILSYVEGFIWTTLSEKFELSAIVTQVATIQTSVDKLLLESILGYYSYEHAKKPQFIWNTVMVYP